MAEGVGEWLRARRGVGGVGGDRARFWFAMSLSAPHGVPIYVATDLIIIQGCKSDRSQDVQTAAAKLHGRLFTLPVYL